MKEGDPAANTGRRAVNGEDAEWRKSSFSEAGNCVEVAKPGDAVLVRDSQNPEGGHVAFSASAFAEFTGSIALVNAGELNIQPR